MPLFSFQRLNDIKLRDKLAGGLLLFTVLPQLVLGSLAVQELGRQTLAEAVASAEQGVSRQEKQILEVLGVAQKISDRLAVDPALASLISTRYASTLEVFRAYHGFETFRIYQDISPEVARIQVYADNPTLLDNWEIRPLSPNLRAAFWYQALSSHPGKTGWFIWSDETKSAGDRLSLVRRLTPRDGPEAVLVLNLDSTRLNSILGQAGLETLILDPNRWVVASSRAELAGKPLADERILGLLAQGRDVPTEAHFGGQSSWIFVRNLAPEASFNGLQIVTIVRPEIILKPTEQITLVGALMIASGAVTSLAFLWVVYSLFARRLVRLSNQLAQVAATQLAQDVEVDGKDEIGAMATGVNSLLRDIRALVAEVSESQQARTALERAQGEIQLKMLASQINPHFLFNVLESIRMKAHLRGEREIAGIVQLLGRLMRRNLEASGRLLSLSEELENVRCYLELEKFRLEEKLDYQIDCTPEALLLPIPPLIIEPLVENAVVHGLEPHYGGGRVTVQASCRGGQLHVAVTDTGQGMTDDAQAQLRGGGDDHRVGFRNVHQRLVLLYGEAAGLTLTSQPGGPTTVQFTLPLEAL